MPELHKSKMDEPVKKSKTIPGRTPMPERPPEERSVDFGEVALGYTLELARAEAARCLQCKNKPCVSGCPVGVPIPEFIEHIKNGDIEGALAAIKTANMLPAVCGRVCPQESQCEKACTLAKKFGAVAIGRLERFAADSLAEHCVTAQAADKPVKEIEIKKTGKSVAIVGSGPAGLACAYDLARKGHTVKVYEALHAPGGVLFYGIPEFRLPKSIVAREIENLKKMGVEIIANAVIGKLFSVDDLLQEHDACFICTGAGLPKFMEIEGEELNGVYSANEFLTRVNLMRAYDFPEYDTPVETGQNIVVAGGGNVAMDAARTALRIAKQAAKMKGGPAPKVYLVYRRSEDELPARKEEVHHAREEGVILETCSNPVRLIGENGKVRAVECVRMSVCEDPLSEGKAAVDSSGRKKFNPIPGSEYLIEADTVIMAIGTGANPLVPMDTPGLELTKRGYIVTKDASGQTSRKGVYAGGDIVTGSATVISAMGAGRLAAKAIDEFLRNEK